MHWYKQDEEGNPVLCDMFDKEFAEWFNNPDNRRVARTDVTEEVQVSTVFLCLDHNFAEKDENYRPVLWETMVFGGPLDQETNRYNSLQAAIDGHADMVRQCMDAVFGFGKTEPDKMPEPVLYIKREQRKLNLDD